MSNKGFTLIELMVVIAVIGILASVILVAYPAAENRAKDGVIMSEMDQLRTAAEISKGTSSDGDYRHLTVATVPTDIAALKADIVSNSPDSAVTITYKGASDYSEYCAEIQLNTGNYWCIDSKYHSQQNAAAVCTTGKDCNGDDI